MSDQIIGTLQIRGDDRIEFLFFHHGDQVVLRDPGVVHQDIEKTEFLFDRRHGFLHFVVIRHIALVDLRLHAGRFTVGLHAFGTFCIAGIDQRHIGTVFGKPPGDGRTDP